ncbi:hypothetical protein H6802_02590 [Candidatus Nomurabacteria bacterium]|uniref:Uncharacterized protein n=1 Tax=candidate division WWE3 bacterium TaxID=2053526 RepID=A0A955IVS7_UNCKA|nr:hypothetical protein [candidate division WWE3 bacterium]MCB9823822.1 hypothetical protein [Candidatus Nomurabacteria bacterium]MCB9826772.1 hypothetical protein [Candidatus Nomurabacteria bacterium]MCB9827617.1 hypothetical protein [Candidatus Nomurabacteria bacterium]HXK52469.1 hypothetical protein [bacterium]
MQIENYDNNQIAELLRDAKSVGIIASRLNQPDTFCAASGLYLMLKNTFEDKEIKLIYKGDIPTECSNLINSEDVHANVDERDLVVTVNYKGTSASKVQYSTEDGVFQFRLGPVPKYFDLGNIQSVLSGFDFDVVVTIGIPDLEVTGSLYSSLKHELSSAKIVNIDNTGLNKRFGSVNVIDTQASSLSTLVFNLAAEWKLKPTAKSAKMLLVGVSSTSID